MTTDQQDCSAPIAPSLKPVIDTIRNISQAGRIRHSRHYADFLSDRIIQASTEPSLLAMLEKLSVLMDVDPGQVYWENIMSAIAVSSSDDACSVLQWIRAYPKIIGMLATLKREDYEDSIVSIDYAPLDPEKTGTALPDTPHDIPVIVHCLSPLAHGSDTKAGNATLFRRMQVLTTTGSVISLPYYAGNAFRGQMRDLLADDFIKRIGLNPRRDKPEIALWFFHALYAGGALSEQTGADKKIRARLGGNGAVKSSAIYEFRNTLPALSLLGCALGNRILSGRFKISDFRPICREWGNSGDVEASRLFEWIFLTRREDHEGHDDDHNSSMIANTECLKAGTAIVGGMDTDMHIMPIELSALGHGLYLMAVNGYLGAENRRGVGSCEIRYDNAPDPLPYLEYLEANKAAIREYLKDVGAIDDSSN